MSLFSKLFSGQINWETANSVQKLAALDELPSNDPVLGQLALGEPDAAVRHKAIGLMEAAAQLQIASSVRTGDENCLAASLGERIGEGGIAVDDALGALASATAGFRIALIAHAKSEPLALALTASLASDAQRAEIARGKGLIDARIAAVGGISEVDLLESIAQEFRDKQRGIYRAARDRADALLAARETQRKALELCERLSGLLARNGLTLSAFTLLEREWTALAPTPALDAAEFAVLQNRYAALKDEARGLLQSQSEVLRDAERLKTSLADLAARCEADAAVEPEGLAALVAEREAAAVRLAHPGLAALPKEREPIAERIARIVERHAILAVESAALVNARKLVEDLRADPAVLTPAWRTDYARQSAIVRASLRAPIEEAATALRSVIDTAAREQADAERSVEQGHRAEIEALIKLMEQLLDKGQHQQANDTMATLVEKRSQTTNARPLPAAMEFRLKRCQDRLAKMNEWKRFGDAQAREALCREAEALAKRVARQQKALIAETTPQADAAVIDTAMVAAPVDDAAVDESAVDDTIGMNEATAPAVEAATASLVQTPAEPSDETVPVPVADSPDTDALPQATSESTTAETPVASDGTAPTAEAPTEVEVEAVSTATEPETQTAAESAAAEAAEAALPPLAPEVVAAAVRDIQARWAKLDKSQGPTSKGLHGRFRRACDRAYAPAKKHFEELEKQREANAEKKNAVMEKLAALNERIAEGAEWGKILSQRGELVKTWFDAGPLPRKDAKAMQKRFDALTKEIDRKLDAQRAAERARRREMIDRARAIAERTAEGGSIAAMIALQKQWQETMKGAIRLRAKEDQTLWEEFRAAGNALFGKRDAEKAALSNERDTQVAARRVLVEEMQSLASGSDAAAVRRAIDDIGSRWNTMEWPDRKPLRQWEQNFSNARSAASARIAELRGEAEKGQRAAAAARLAVVERAEQALGDGTVPDMDAVRAEVQAMLADGEKPDARVTARLASLEAAAKAGPDAWRAKSEKTRIERDALLLELEIVLDLPSPPQLEGERRMRLLKRLAESKNSRSTPPLAAADAAKAVEKLLALPLAMQDVHARVDAVIEATRRKSK